MQLISRRRTLPRALLAAFLLAVSVVGPLHVVQAATFTVDSTADTSDSNAGDGVCDDGTGSCTLL